MKKVFLALSCLALGLVLYFFLNGDREAGHKLKLGPAAYMEDVGITQRKGEEVSWTLRAKRADFLTGKDVRLTELEVRFPERGLVLTSQNATYDIDKKDFTIEGNVTASTRDFSFVAPALSWDSAQNELTSDSRVIIVGKKFSIEGEGLKATPDKATLQNKVKAVFGGG